ncbi:glucokinase [Cognatiyoonia sediminum]|uniref:Glucokinase n=1 Tax=Cognatiyoonia sediminum TaxID=1508389 RepID=A0A1M5MJ14_9RHOB|nr:ROK family protein [Cognatiyoonia sediminum]SHG77298.1 glucokinase [Cognatiyoonia sediminum]
MAHAPNTLNLVADIGGTNTRVALARGKMLLPETVTKYKNTAHSSLQDVLKKFIQEQGGVDTSAACIAIAGPVRNGQASMTNLDWEIDLETLADASKAENTAILNDLQAQGHALGHLPPESETQIIHGTSIEKETTRMMVGLGTGFNIAPVFETPNGRFIPPSESGHISLPINTEMDRKLSAHFDAQFGFPTIEHALSGNGLENLYNFHCCGVEGAAHKNAATIVADCEAGIDPAATRAVRHFVQILGSVCGDLALVQLPFSGIYLVGGVSRAIAPHLSEFGFLDAFRAKGRFEDFMNSFSVAAISDDFAALTGCAAYLESSAHA